MKQDEEEGGEGGSGGLDDQSDWEPHEEEARS